MRTLMAFVLFLGLGSTRVLADTAAERLAESATVMKEILDAPDKGIPDDLLRKAQCVVVVPGVKKAGFVVEARTAAASWCAERPTATGAHPPRCASKGAASDSRSAHPETDSIMLVMDPRSMRGILDSKFTLGGAADVAAGPVGRSSTAQTDATMNAKILSYSRSRGAFAGVALTGATLRQDLDENAELYGKAPLEQGRRGRQRETARCGGRSAGCAWQVPPVAPVIANGPAKAGLYRPRAPTARVPRYLTVFCSHCSILARKSSFSADWWPVSAQTISRGGFASLSRGSTDVSLM